MIMRNSRLIVLLEGALIAAIAVALSFIPLNLPNASFDLSLGLVPLCIYALRRGLLPGLAVGFIWGLLLIVLGKAYIITVGDEPKYLFYLYLQPVLEYPIAFAAGGMAGLFSKRVQTCIRKETPRLLLLFTALAGITAACCRWFIHFWAGVLFWGAYANGMNVYVYSGIMNGLSAVANAAMLVIVLCVIAKTAPRLIATRLPDNQD